VTMGFATLAASFPNFVVGALMVVVFSVLMSKWTEHAFFLPSADFGLDDHLIMPVITLALLPIAYTARLTRASTLDTIRQDFIRTAWAKGLSERLVVVKHVLKNSLIPVVTTLGPTFAILVTGSVIVETVFNIPGIGRAFVVAVTSRDYPMILGTTVLFSVVIAIANLVVDLAYVFIDPRVRLSYQWPWQRPSSRRSTGRSQRSRSGSGRTPGAGSAATAWRCSARCSSRCSS